MNIKELKEAIKDLDDNTKIKCFSDPEGNSIDDVYTELSYWCDSRESLIPIEHIKGKIEDGNTTYYEEWGLEEFEWLEILEDTSNRTFVISP